MRTVTTITLPMPCSLNGAYRNVAGVGRVATKRLMTWKRAAGWELKAQRPEPIKGPVALSLIMPRPLRKDGKTWDRRRQDASNRIKCVEDLLVEMGLIEDDSHTTVYEVAARWDDSGTIPQGQCLVHVYSLRSRSILEAAA
jgi:Holliday junction resolvase RusA-like endonuclease